MYFRASSLIHRDRELDALVLDDYPPRLNLEYAEQGPGTPRTRRDDVSFPHHPAVNQRPRTGADHRGLQAYLACLLLQPLNEVQPLLNSIGSPRG